MGVTYRVYECTISFQEQVKHDDSVEENIAQLDAIRAFIDELNTLDNDGDLHKYVHTRLINEDRDND